MLSPPAHSTEPRSDVRQKIADTGVSQRKHDDLAKPGVIPALATFTRNTDAAAAANLCSAGSAGDPLHAVIRHPAGYLCIM